MVGKAGVDAREHCETQHAVGAIRRKKEAGAKGLSVFFLGCLDCPAFLLAGSRGGGRLGFVLPARSMQPAQTPQCGTKIGKGR